MRCPVLVGRVAELGALREAVRRPGSWINVVGEAGIGKTRLVGEFASEAAGRVVTGRCSVVDRATAYRPLAEAVLALSADVPLPVPSGVGPYASALARFVPAWRDRPSVASESPAVLGESLLRLLGWWAGEGPAVLVLEDVHWADSDTMATCEYVADHLAGTPVVVLATWRPDELPPSSARVLRQHRSLRLSPLTAAEVGEMAAACLGQALPAPAVERLIQSSSGLPLLVEDLLDDDAAPARFAAMVAERLGRISDSAVPAVVAAALLGERFELPLLAESLRGRDIEATVAVQQAITAGLVVADAGGFRFRHALTHDAVLAAAPALRAEMAQAVAAALAAAGSARHLARAAQLRADAGEPAAAAELFERAAALVDRDGTPGVALSLLDRARALVPDGAGRVRVDRARLDHLAALGRAEEVDRLGSALLDSVTGDDENAVRLTLARAALDAGRPDRAADHLDAVGAFGADEPVRLVLRARLALQSGGGDRRLVAEHLAHQAIAASDGHGATRCEALELAARCARSRSLDDAASLLGRALSVAEGAALTSWRLRLLTELGTVEMLKSADGARLRRALEAARAAGALDVAVAASVNLAALHAMRGELEPARTTARAAHDDALRLGLRPLAAAALVMEALCQGFRGERAPMERLLRAAHDLAPDDGDLEAFAWGAGRGLCALVREERADAVRAFSRAVRDDVPVGSLDSARAPRLLVLEVAGEASDGDRAGARATATPGAGWSDLWLGYAEAVGLGAVGGAAAAGRAFERADAAGRRHPLFRAIGLRLVAEAALRDGWGDPVDWLRQAEAVFVSGGQARIASACRGLLKQAGAPATRRRGADRELPDRLLHAGVTAREAEVLTLVGERLSNKEIGARLYLSPRTVEKHVASLLLKLGVADRTALARVGAEQPPPRTGA